MNPRFWKLSQGGDDFIERDVLMSIESGSCTFTRDSRKR
jgi:hypothetical protein